VTYTYNQDRIWRSVLLERERQEYLKEKGKFPWTCADAAPASMKFTVLGEEFGEVARAVCEQDWKNLREELIQTAAVCVAWVEALDSGR